MLCKLDVGLDTYNAEANRGSVRNGAEWQCAGDKVIQQPIENQDGRRKKRDEGGEKSAAV